MVPTETTENRAARAPVKRTLTLRAAVEQWEQTERAMQGLKPLRDDAARVILEHAERTGKRTYKDKIAVESTGGSVVLDQAAAVKFILDAGRKLRDFQKTTKRGLTLKLLK